MAIMKDPFYVVELELEFTRAEVELLILCSQRHYDAKCKSASIPGPGAFLNGLKNHLQIDLPPQSSDTASVSFKSHEVDLSCKLCENAHIHGEDAERVTELYWFFKKTLEHMRDLSRKVNG